MGASLLSLLILSLPVSEGTPLRSSPGSLSNCDHALRLLAEHTHLAKPIDGFVAAFDHLIFEIPPSNLWDMRMQSNVTPRWIENNAEMQAIWDLLKSSAKHTLSPWDLRVLVESVQNQMDLVLASQPHLTTFAAERPVGRAAISPTGSFLELWLMTNPNGAGLSVTEGAVYDIFNRRDLSNPKQIQKIPFGHPAADANVLPASPRILVRRNSPVSLDIVSVLDGRVESTYSQSQLGIDVWKDSELSESGEFLIFRGLDDAIQSGVPVREHVQLIDFRKRNVTELARYVHGHGPGLWFSFWKNSVVRIETRADQGFDIIFFSLFRNQEIRHRIKSAYYGSFSNFGTDEISRPVFAAISSGSNKKVVDVYHLSAQFSTSRAFMEPTSKITFSSNLMSVALSRNARWLAAIDESHRVHLYDLKGGRFVPIPYIESVSSFSFSPRSDRLLLVARGLVHMLNLKLPHD